MSKAATLIALATLNEIDNLPSLVDAILQVVPDADILVVDDNSPDGTGRWCDERAKDEPRLKCVRREAKRGLGSATIDAMRLAISGDYSVIVTMDADWSHDPAYLPALVAATAGADVVIGSRYCPGGAIEGWPLRRRVLSQLMNTFSHALLHLPVQDSSGAFRAYRVATLQKLNLDEIKSTGYAYLEEILCHLHRMGARFTEVPITFRDRRGGRSKSGLRIAKDKLRTVLRLAGERRPS
ncbi:MAG TPA: polyprenol monophosphomannose synthase [Lacipirellulaceae bacterium]|jgi:dolichol-phosphate mannosyltransferase